MPAWRLTADPDFAVFSLPLPAAAINTLKSRISPTGSLPCRRIQRLPVRGHAFLNLTGEAFVRRCTSGNIDRQLAAELDNVFSL